MDLRTILSSLGMSENESKAYLSLLELGTAPLSVVARRAGLRRPAALEAVKQLRKRGLADTFAGRGAHAYCAASPKLLFSQYAERLRALETALPDLLAKHDRVVRRPRAGFDEGKAALEKRYAEAWAAEGELDAFLLPSAAAAFFSKPALKKEYAQRSGAALKRSRFLCSGAPEHRLSATLLPSGARVRFLPPDFCLTQEIFTAGDVVRVFSFGEAYALRMDSAEAAANQRAFFEAAWKSAG